MPEKKTIAVVGATGAQGGGLVRAILGDRGGSFHARALTRDVHSARARELADLGAEVVAADVDDEDSLKRAFEGASGHTASPFTGRTFRPRRRLPKPPRWPEPRKRPVSRT